MVGCVVLFTRVTLPPCGYCLEASMTATLPLPLWIADQVRNDGGVARVMVFQNQDYRGFWRFAEL